ncbi:MAG: hypothetical protein AAFP03_08050 [Cyanobacteria bacterium J06598_3]
MKLASFRLRIALLSVALAGGALVGFGLVAWRLIYVAKVGSLDAKLKGQLQRMVARTDEAGLTRSQLCCTYPMQPQSYN